MDEAARTVDSGKTPRPATPDTGRGSTVETSTGAPSEERAEPRPSHAQEPPAQRTEASRGDTQGDSASASASVSADADSSNDRTVQLRAPRPEASKRAASAENGRPKTGGGTRSTDASDASDGSGKDESRDGDRTAQLRVARPDSVADKATSSSLPSRTAEPPGSAPADDSKSPAKADEPRAGDRTAQLRVPQPPAAKTAAAAAKTADAKPAEKTADKKPDDKKAVAKKAVATKAVAKKTVDKPDARKTESPAPAERSRDSDGDGRPAAASGEVATKPREARPVRTDRAAEPRRPPVDMEKSPAAAPKASRTATPTREGTGPSETKRRIADDVEAASVDPDVELDEEEDEEEEGGRRRRLPAWVELPLMLAFGLLVVVVLHSYVAQPFVIPSGSMEHTLEVGDRVLVNKLAYSFGDRPRRGDVVVFDGTGVFTREGKDSSSNPFGKAFDGVGSMFGFGDSDETDFVKRVIGVGGDHVICCDDQGRVTVNGVPLEESSYLYPGDVPSAVPFNVIVPKGKLWVMGDHRANSADSREHIAAPGGGFVPEDRVVGRVDWIIWPVGRMGGVDRPSTFSQPGIGRQEPRVVPSRG